MYFSLIDLLHNRHCYSSQQEEHMWNCDKTIMRPCKARQGKFVYIASLRHKAIQSAIQGQRNTLKQLH